jgi:hypothetical protein
MAFDDACKGTIGPNHPDPKTPSNTRPGCEPNASGDSYCPPVNADKTCNPFQLTKNRDSCFIDNVVNESLNIGGAEFNVYKLLGVHEQCKTVDATGKGKPLSSGAAPGFPASQAFDKFITEWRSVQRGDGVVASSYIGYDFGEIKTNDDSRRLYGIETSIRKHITAIAIKQSANANNRVTRARIERSEDGRKWYGVAVVNFPDDDCLNTILFRDSVPNQYWRIRPITFNGGPTDYWGVQAIQMFHNYIATAEWNIQDKIFLENRDRDYAPEPMLIKGSYDLIDVQSELSKFGIELPSQTIYATVNFSACVAILGRPLIIGDIIELPSEAQWSAEMRRILKWVEVTDVAWSTDGYTPGWQPTLLRVVMQPAFASQETQDIFGDLAEQELPDELGLVDKGDGRHTHYQDYSDISQTIQAESKDMVPQSGRETSGTIRAWEQEEVETAAAQGVPLQRIGQNPKAVYTEDAMPPNNAPFTEGPEYPQDPKHGEYHRLTYEGLSKDVPARLYRYSSSKGRWVYLETDRRAEFDPNKPRLQEFLTAPGRVSNTEIFRKNPDQCEDE